MHSEGGLPTRNALWAEAALLGLVYIILVALFFMGAAHFAHADLGADQPRAYVGNSLALDLTSGVLSFTALSLGVWHVRGQRMAYNIAACFGISTVVVLVDFLIVSAITKYALTDARIEIFAPENLKSLFFCWATYFGWACIFLTLLYSHDVRDRERRLAVVREEALSAQMRALRYQVNPHFLFNALNSVAGLIEEGAGSRAGRMVMSLSTFLRTTLSLDPLHDAPLADEVAVQAEYLEIEHERFADRMTFQVDLPAAVGQARVPSLILQPLIENAVKHGVCATPGPVTITLTARREGDRLRLTVENDMPLDQTGAKPAGMGVGLTNVAARLNARFHDQARFTAGPAAPGRYRATLELPWQAD